MLNDIVTEPVSGTSHHYSIYNEGRGVGDGEVVVPPFLPNTIPTLGPIASLMQWEESLLIGEVHLFPKFTTTSK